MLLKFQSKSRVGRSLDQNEKVLISRECIEKIRTELKIIKVNTNNRNFKKDVSKLLDMLESELNYDNISLKEKIFSKMKETKNSDPSMNANLYILYRNLVNGRITEEEALELYNMYIKIEPYDKTIE
ncbi:hypothetical protein GTH52_02430 [Clostridium tyrobutyricum]|jgi:hypothetical protein|nr:hypothetical protein BA182_09185 [Clostridium tyrobutyricum]QNB65789.1 hypothetical protein GTH52_02430 [Clostridium tyrobutyricum]